MKPHLSMWIAGTLLLGAPSTSVSAQTPTFDGRGWTVGNQQKNANESLTEYVLPGQTVEDWKELVTSTVFYQPVPLDKLVEKLRSSLASGCPSFVWNVIRQDERTAVYEFHDAGCGGFEATSELDRVTIEKDGMYRLAYAAKVKGPLAPARRKEWLEILSQVPLAEGPVGARPQPGTPAAANADSKGAAPFKKFTTEQLVAEIRRVGWACPAGVKSEVKGQTPGPEGPMTIWLLECSNGQKYAVLVQPSGAISAFPQQQ